MPCDYIWLQREKRYMKKRKRKRKRKRGWEHFLLLIPLSSPVVSPRAGEEGRSRRSGQGAGGREAPPRRSPTQGDGPFLTSLLQEKRRPASPRPRIKQPLWSARPPVSVLMEIRACLPATLSARMQSWSAFPAGTADDNDVLKGSWAFIVYSPFSAFLFFFLSFFFPPRPRTFLANMLDLAQRVVFCALLGSVYASCPPRCECSEAAHTVKCVSRDLRSVPTGIPGYTRNLFITGNQISRIGPESFKGLENVTNLSLSNNR